MTVAYPATFGVIEFEAELRRAGFNFQALPRAIEFDHNAPSFVPIDVLAMMVCLYNALAHAGVRVSVRWASQGSTFSYAERVGFFAALDASVAVLPDRPDATGRFAVHRGGKAGLMELTTIARGDTAARTDALTSLHDHLTTNLAGVPGASEAVDRIVTCASETLDNIDEHSESPVPGVIAVQRYSPKTKSSDNVMLVIADGGLGLPTTIRNAKQRYVATPDADIILEAFAKGLSRRMEPGAGLGLPQCASIAWKYRGNLRVRTAGVAVALITSAAPGIALGKVEEVAFVAGTQLTFVFRVDRPAR